MTLAVTAPPAVVPIRAGGLASLLLLRLLRAVGAGVAAVVVIVVLWYAFIKAFNLNPLVAKDPLQVWRYLVSDADAAAHRSTVMSGLGQTLGDAAAGYVAGTVASMVLAVAFVLSQSLERSLMPVVMILRTMPLVALTPLITLVFHRGLVSTTVIAGIVVFIPSLVNMVFGLRSGPKAATDLLAAYGAGPLTTLRKVSIPSALPAFFASARIAVPGAIIGALLAEWLATGKGLGYLMLSAGTTFDYDVVWAAVVIITLASILLYALVGVIEAAVLSQYGPAPARGR